MTAEIEVFAPPVPQVHPGARRRQRLSDTARIRLQKSVPDETRRAYEREWKGFVEWCAAWGEAWLPCDADVLTNWVADRCEEGDGLSAISQGIAAVVFFHDQGGYKDHPETDDAWRVFYGYKRERLDAGWRPTKSATFTLEEFRRMVATLPDDTPSGIRDRAILGIGLGGFFRRRNIVMLRVEDVSSNVGGDLVLRVTRSKTDQSARGKDRTIPPGSDPLSDAVALAQALLDLLAAQGITSGPLFRKVSRSGRFLDRPLNPDWVRKLVKKTAADAGLSSPRNRPFRAHSLRSSGVTIARRAGKTWSVICEQGDWSERSPVVYAYDQPEEQDNAMRGVM